MYFRVSFTRKEFVDFGGKVHKRVSSCWLRLFVENLLVKGRRNDWIWSLRCPPILLLLRSSPTGNVSYDAKVGEEVTHAPSGWKLWIQEWEAKSGSATDLRAYISAPPKRKDPNWPFPSTTHPSAPTCSNGYSPWSKITLKCQFRGDTIELCS